MSNTEQETITETISMVLEELEIGLEIKTDSDPFLEYVVGYDGDIWHTAQGNEPEKITAEEFKELLKADTMYVVGWHGLHEFEGVLPNEILEP